MRYVILIWSNPESRAMWSGFTPDQQADGFRAYGEIVENLIATGELVLTHALADASQGRLVTSRDGQVTATDGPFAEAKELLAGFFVIDCDGIERATEIAAGFPEADLGLIEVRPVMTLELPGA